MAESSIFSATIGKKPGAAPQPSSVRGVRTGRHQARILRGGMRFSIKEIDVLERYVIWRTRFGSGAATLTRAPQAFVRARIRLENGEEAEGGAAELLVPKWFDKDPSLSDEENFDQLRASLALGRESYLAMAPNTAFGHSIDIYGPQIAIGALQGMNSLVACYGPALIYRALLDALCRAANLSFFQVVQKNVAGIQAPGWPADLSAFDMDAILEGLKPQKQIAARHTVGLLDPLVAADVKRRGGGRAPQTPQGAIPPHRPRLVEI